MKKIYTILFTMLLAFVGTGSANAKEYQSGETVDLTSLEVGDIVNVGTTIYNIGVDLYFNIFDVFQETWVVGSGSQDYLGVAFGTYFTDNTKFILTEVDDFFGYTFEPYSGNSGDSKPTSYTVNIGGNNGDGKFYGTFYAEQKVEIPSGVVAYNVRSVSGEGVVDMNAIIDGSGNNVLNAGVPVILEANSPGNVTLNVSSQSGVNAYSEYLRGSLVDGSDRDDEHYFYKLSYNSEGNTLGFYWEAGTGGISISTHPNKAYLVIPKTIFNSNTPSNGLTFRFADAEGISAVATAKDEAIYNLQGQRINGNAAGVYVQNGKKVIR